MNTKAELLKELEAIKAKIEALDEPEVEMVKGRLYEVTDDDWFEYPAIVRYGSTDRDGDYLSLDKEGYEGCDWKHWRQ